MLLEQRELGTLVIRYRSLTVPWIAHLMDQIVHIILTVYVASLAIVVGGIFDFVLNHRLVGLEVFEAIFISALEFASHFCD